VNPSKPGKSTPPARPAPASPLERDARRRRGEALRAFQTGDDDEARAALSRLGFHQPEASWKHLARLAATPDAKARRAFLATLVPALAASADPDLAAVNLARFAEARCGPDRVAETARLPRKKLELLAALFGFSQFLADRLIRHPDYLDWLLVEAELEHPRTTERYAELLRQAMQPHEAARERRLAALRAMRRELLRLGVRRLLDVSDEMEMTRELSDLATATLRAALEEVQAPLAVRFGPPLEEDEDAVRGGAAEAGFAVIAMGKLGGRELNFSSDIDLLFVYSAEGRTRGKEGGAGRISNHVFFTKLAEALIAWVADPSEEGTFYRVDTRLRPDGETGALTRSLLAYEIYYETQARPWERLALLKARAAAGDAALGAAFERMSRPLVFDPLHSGELVAQIHDLKRRIDREIHRRAGAQREIKRGAGGIRELEFLVQTMQMLQGAHDTRLWTAQTLEAIARLGASGLLDPQRAARMREDYIFLRTIEHRLQMVHLRQTHMMPEDPAALDALALRCGLGCTANERPGAILLRRWSEVSRRVHQDFKDFFDPASKATGAEKGAPAEPLEQAVRLILSAASEKSVTPALEPYGLAGSGALKTLRRLAGLGRETYLSAEGGRAFEALLPRILELSRVNPRPEAALASLESFLNASGALASYYETFLANPPTFELLLLAFGSGSALAQTLVAHPEFLDTLADPAQFASHADRAALAGLLGRWLERAGDEEAFCAALARFRRLEFLLAGLGEIAGLLDYASSCQRLTVMAEVLIEQALERGALELGLEGPLKNFCVLAMGKLGTGELNYYSDLDLIFVWDEGFAAGHAAPGETATALSNRLIELLTRPTPEGAAFNIDARLRPEGQNAPIAPPLGRYLAYYASERAQLWEFQSAMKLRPIAGDLGLGERLCRALTGIISRRTRGLELAGAIRAMRRRMEAALKLARWVACDLKSGPGGTVDLEFIAQYLQLRHLAEDPRLMGLGPLSVLGQLNATGRLDPALAGQLSADYVWLRRIERRARLLFESGHALIPSGGEKLIALERACAPLRADPAMPLIEELTRVMLRNRRHFEQIIL